MDRYSKSATHPRRGQCVLRQNVYPSPYSESVLIDQSSSDGHKVDDINPLDFYDFNQGVTRHADHKLYIKCCRINVRKYSFAFRTAKAWNALTIRTRRARSVDVFKRLLDLDESKSIGIFEYD